MALIDTITLGDVKLLIVDSDPTSGGGIAAPEGSLVLVNNGSGLFQKTAAGNTSWSKGVTEATLSAITATGTITSGTWNASVIGSTYGGTGINNSGRTLTISTNSGTLNFTSATTLTIAAAASVSGTNTGDQTITLTGEATGTGTGSFAVSLTNSSVIGKVLTGYVSGAGTVAATDTILQAIQKLNGNIGLLGSSVSSVSGTTNRITSSGGLTPIIDIAATYIGQTSITTLGTISSGTWNGTSIGTQYGGTGANNSTNTSGSFLRSNGVNGTYVASTLTLPNSATTGDILIATGTNIVGSLADVAVGRVLTSGGVGVAPSYSATPTLGVAGTIAGSLSLAGNISGTVTLLTQAAAGGWVLTLPTSAGTNGQVLNTDGSSVTSWTAVPKLLWTNSSAVSLNNVTGTIIGTGLGSLTLAANTLVSGSVIRVRVKANASGNNKTLTMQVKIGSTVIVSTTNSTNTNGGQYTYDCDITTHTAGVSNASSIIGSAFGIIGAVVQTVGQSATIIAVDTTVSNLIDVTLSANTFTPFAVISLTVEKLN